MDFRLEVYASFTLRADALFELLESLLLSPMIRSAVDVHLPGQGSKYANRVASRSAGRSPSDDSTDELEEVIAGRNRSQDDRVRSAGACGQRCRPPEN